MNESITFTDAALSLCFWCNELGTEVELGSSGEYYHVNDRGAGSEAYMYYCQATPVRIEAAKK